MFVSGQGPYEPGSGAIVGATIHEQVAQCFRNISAILEAGGSSLKHVVSATFILAHPEDFAGLNEEWIRWFPDEKPARQGAKFPAHIEGLRVSIAVIAEA